MCILVGSQFKRIGFNTYGYERGQHIGHREFENRTKKIGKDKSLIKKLSNKS